MPQGPRQNKEDVVSPPPLQLPELSKEVVQRGHRLLPLFHPAELGRAPHLTHPFVRGRRLEHLVEPRPPKVSTWDGSSLLLLPLQTVPPGKSAPSFV